jgi:glycosyltransferase involved in cell wall biosynthesis
MPRSLLFAGRLTARKGCSWFVKNVLPHLDDDVTLHIAGTGWDPTEECVLTHPQVRYLGLLDKQTLAQAYAEALCVIVPNIELANGEFEGFGLVAVEAAAAGGIVLAADHGGLRDAVIDGESGYLIESGNAEAWIEAVGRICSMPSAENSAFRTKAQNTAREYYNWSRVADEILALAETDL